MFLPFPQPVSPNMLAAASIFLFLLPLAITPHLLFYYDITPKVALIFLSAAAGLAAAFFRLDYLWSFVGTKFGRAYALAAAASLLLAIATAAASPNASLAWNGSNWRRYGALTECAVIVSALLLSAFVAGYPSRLRAVVKAICASGLLASLYGIAQYFRWDPLLKASSYEAGEGIFQIVRPPSTMGHADYFSAYLVWPVLAGIGLAVEQKRVVGKLIWPKLLWIITVVAGIAAIVLSGSRGAIVALAAGLLICCVVLRPRFRSTAAAAALAVAIFAGFYFSPAGLRLRARVHWISEDREGGARLLLWRDSLRMATAKPLVGFGPDNFIAEFPRFQSVELAEQFPNSLHESAHNILLDSLTSEGLGGMAALIAFGLIGILAGVKSSNGGPVKTSLLAAFVATCVAHQFIAFTAPTAFYFYLGAGLLAGLEARAEAGSVHLPYVRWFALPASALFGVLAIVALFADAQLAKIDRRLDAGDMRGAAEAYRAALKHRSTGISADLYFARRFAAAATKFSDLPSRIYYSQIAAGAASLAARQPEQRQNALYTLSMFAASGQNPSVVESALRSTIAAGPNWYKPHWALARLLSAEGRSQEAHTEASRALELNAGKDPEVAATLRELASSGGQFP